MASVELKRWLRVAFVKVFSRKKGVDVCKYGKTSKAKFRLWIELRGLTPKQKLIDFYGQSGANSASDCTERALRWIIIVRHGSCSIQNHFQVHRPSIAQRKNVYLIFMLNADFPFRSHH